MTFSWLITSNKETLFHDRLYIHLFVSRITQVLPVGSSWKKLEDSSWSNLDPIKFWESSLSPSVFKKNNPDFAIYLLLCVLAEVCSLWVLLLVVYSDPCRFDSTLNRVQIYWFLGGGGVGKKCKTKESPGVRGGGGGGGILFYKSIFYVHLNRCIRLW